MPTISMFFGIVIQMYWRDHNPPHLHPLHQGQEALFDISNGQVIGGALPRKAARIVAEWIESCAGLACWITGSVADFTWLSIKFPDQTSND
jgi:hypothetical protein